MGDAISHFLSSLNEVWLHETISKFMSHLNGCIDMEAAGRREHYEYLKTE